ncbi:MAG: hypothetical protein CVT79_14240 [Alphaproteobacteria bacterium HGW-Alphaproteobacteria-18]|nr:MAG: hypothetical protein CVT79_14240 [Alphaproteobacteria bacterium HGW-Alphaproteobacteria-18]
MTTRLAVLPLISAAWTGARAALKPAGLWLILFAMAGGLYGAALRSEMGFWVPFGAAILAFLAGTEFSRRTYRALIPGAKAPFLPLAHANLSVYFLFLLLLVFIAPLLNLLSGILIRAKGTFALGAESPSEEVGAAMLDLLASTYGAVFILCCLIGAGLICWIALRLTLYGAATAATGKAHVFRTWGLTKGGLKTLAPASLATHVLPFILGVGVNGALHRALPDTGIGHFIGGAAGVIVFAPFLLAGHGMAAAAWEKLKPGEPVLAPPVSGD